MLLFANNADSTLRLPILATDVLLYLAAGTGARFPSPGAGESFFLTLVDTLGSIEIVECTSRTGDTCTVVRGRDGTTAKGFPAGTVVDHRVVAEVLRRMSVDSVRGVEDGVAPLDGDARVPLVHLPTSVQTTTTSDARYVRLSTMNQPNGYAGLDGAGLISMSLLPGQLLTLSEGDAAYVKASEKGTANGVATLGADGKVPSSQLDTASIDLSPYAPKLDPTFTNGLTAGGTATLTNVVVTGTAQLADMQADSIATSDVVVIKGGAPYGKRTLSTSPPSGTPADGDEWIQHEA